MLTKIQTIIPSQIKSFVEIRDFNNRNCDKLNNKTFPYISIKERLNDSLSVYSCLINFN